MQSADRKLPGKFRALLFALFLSWPALLVDTSGPPMVDAVLLAAVRLVDAGTWTVSDDPPQVALLTAAIDISVYDGRVYSGAAPGATLLAAPVYAVLKPLFAYFDHSDVKSPRALNFYGRYNARLGRSPRHIVDTYLLQITLTWLVMAPLSAAFGVRFVELLWSENGLVSRALAIALSATLASFLLYYASCYSRQALASLLVWHAALTVARGRDGFVELLGAAALLAFALSVDYGMLAVVALLLLVWLPRLAWAERTAVLGVLALGAFGLGAYHASLFGSPWSTPYQHRVFLEGRLLRGPDLHAVGAGGVGGIGIPRFDVMLELLLGSYKGVFMYCPVLALAAIGHVRAIASASRRRLHVFCVLVVVVYLALNSAIASHLPPSEARVFWGGLHILWGPRHILVTLPFLAIGLTGLDWASARVRWATGIALGISFCLSLLGCVTRQQFATASVADERLEHPLSLAASFAWQNGLRFPLLDAYGVNPGIQWLLFSLLSAGSIAILVFVVRRLGLGPERAAPGNV